MLGLVWVASASFHYYLAIKLGKQTGSVNDGCLVGICMIVLSLLGGGLGFLSLMHSFPYFILSSILGSIAFPGGVMLILTSRRRP